MSETSHSTHVVHDAEVTVADFVLAPSDDLAKVTSCAESLYFEAVQALPEGETVINNTRVTIGDGEVRITSGSPSGHPAYTKEVVIKSPGEGQPTRVMHGWFDVVDATDDKPEIVTPRYVEIVVGTDEELLQPDLLGADVYDTPQSQVNRLLGNLSRWHRTISEYRPPAKRTWLSRLVTFHR
jgi:hypothetical protein